MGTPVALITNEDRNHHGTATATGTTGNSERGSVFH